MFELRQAERAERPGSRGAAFGRRRRGAGRCSSAGEGGGWRVVPGDPERWAPSRSGVPRPTQDLRLHAGKFRGAGSCPSWKWRLRN